MPGKLFGKVMPGRKDTLGPDARHGIEDVIEDLDARMRHADLVDIREGQRKADLNLIICLDDLVDFTPDIPGRFGYGFNKLRIVIIVLRSVEF